MKRRLIFLTAILAAGGLRAAAAQDMASISDPTILQIPHVTANVGGSRCYREEEAEAEQAVRIHSELMVIGLNCQNMPSIPNSAGLYQKYRIFTAKHGKLLAEYEARLIGYYLRTGTRDPNGALNTMRTEFANKIALDSAHMRPDLFCSQYAPRIARVGSMSDADYRKWASTFYPGHPLNHPICGH